MLGTQSKRLFLFGNATCFSFIAFGSYFDVYSHRFIFVGTDPWYNPAHILLYSGFGVLLLTVLQVLKNRDRVINLSITGILISLGAAGFNEFWHRVLLFGNPRPEPFPVEPPHALLAIGLIVSGVAALVYPFKNRELISDTTARVAISFLSGSLWLIITGSAFFVGGALSSTPAILFAVATASFSASLFLAYTASFTRRFGFATLSYLWYMGVNFVFFLSISDGLPFGIILVGTLDYLLIEHFITRTRWLRYFGMLLIGAMYGVIYFPLLPVALTFAFSNPIGVASLGASFLGVFIEFIVERSFIKSVRKITPVLSSEARSQPS